MSDWIIWVLLGILETKAQKFPKHQNGGIGCYKCYSYNGSDEHCGDPFHPAYNMHRFHGKCEQGMDKRVGLFPARFCTKIKGTNLQTNEEIIFRSCSMSAFDNTCGLFEFENVRYSGCLMSCTRNACNGGQSSMQRSNFFPMHAGILFLLSSLSLAVPVIFTWTDVR